MKKLWLLLLIAVTSLSLLAACGGKKGGNTSKPDTDSVTDTDTDSSQDIDVADILLNKDELKLYLGGTYALGVTVLPENATDKTVEYASLNDGIVSVDNKGVLTAKAIGSTQIEITAGNIIKTASVEVIDETQEGYYFYTTFSADNLNPQLDMQSTPNGEIAVNDGMLGMTTSDNEYVSGTFVFENGVDGYLVAGGKVKVGSSEFSNLFYFYTLGTTVNDIVCSVAANGGKLQIHNGTSWVTVCNMSVNTWYEVEVLLRIGDYTGSANKGQMDIKVNDTWYKNYPLRSGGDGVEDCINRFFFGSNKSGAKMYYDSLYLKKASKPYILLESHEAELNIDENNKYKLNMELDGNPMPTVIVECDKAGWSYSNGEITFTSAGTYEFTVKAVNEYGEDTSNLKIIATGSILAPEIIVNKNNETVILTKNDTYTLDYTFSEGVPAAEKSITCDMTEGYTLSGDVVTFTSAGVYTFIITAENAGGTATKTITVNVLADDTLYHEDFSEKKDYMSVSATGSNSITFADGKMHVVTGSSSASAFIDMPINVKLEQSYYMYEKFTVNTQAFSNILFLLAPGNTPANNGGICIGVEKLALKCHNGTGWVTVTNVTAGKEYELFVLFDYENGKVKIYLDGAYMGEYAVRNLANAQNATHFYLGSDKINTDYYIDEIKIGYISEVEISSEETSARVDVSVNPVYTLNYTAYLGSPSGSVEITCDKPSGYTINGDEITFVASGTYQFTVTAKNLLGSKSVIITIDVLSETVAPEVTVSENEVNFDINTNEGKLQLGYTVTGEPQPEVEITCDKDAGFAIEGNTVTFTEEGVYVFTVTATSGALYDSATITVNAYYYSAPVITVASEVINKDITVSGVLSLGYEVNSKPLAKVQVTCDKMGGYIDMGDGQYLFTKAGAYTFTIKAEALSGNDEKTVVVNATENAQYALDEEFETSEGVSVTTSNNGSYTVENGKLIMTVGESTGGTGGNNVLYGANADNSKISSGRVVVKTVFYLDQVRTCNALMLYSGDSGSTANNVLGVIFNGDGHVNIHDGDKWKGILDENDEFFIYEANKWYELTVVYEVGASTFELYINGVLYHKYSSNNVPTEGLKMRNPEKAATADRVGKIGFDQRSDGKITVECVKVYAIIEETQTQE